MRFVLFFALAASIALAQSAPQTQSSGTKESLRGVSAVSHEIAWASGTHGTYLRTTDGGKIWTPEQVPGAGALDFRAVVAFSADEAYLMSAGSGDQSRIYHTTDIGRHWQLEYTNSNPKGFFDSMVFWDSTHGIVLGDPVPDETGKLKFEVLMTEDGKTWKHVPAASLPPAMEGEGAFAASNSCLAILPKVIAPSTAGEPGFSKTTVADTTTGPPNTAHNIIAMDPAVIADLPLPYDSNIWFATGGKVARVFHSPDRGKTWQVFDTPIVHGVDSTGIFSIAFRDALHGAIAGGDYKHPDQDGPNLAFTEDGGKTWTLSQIYPQFYYSAVAYDLGPKKENRDRVFVIGPKSIYDFRPPRNPTRIAAKEARFNAVAPYPGGGALVVGPEGSVASIP